MRTPAQPPRQRHRARQTRVLRSSSAGLIRSGGLVKRPLELLLVPLQQQPRLLRLLRCVLLLSLLMLRACASLEKRMPLRLLRLLLPLLLRQRRLPRLLLLRLRLRLLSRAGAGEQAEQTRLLLLRALAARVVRAVSHATMQSRKILPSHRWLSLLRLLLLLLGNLQLGRCLPPHRLGVPRSAPHASRRRPGASIVSVDRGAGHAFRCALQRIVEQLLLPPLRGPLHSRLVRLKRCCCSWRGRAQAQRMRGRSCGGLGKRIAAAAVAAALGRFRKRIVQRKRRPAPQQV